MIKIKSFFTPWHEVTEEEAVIFVEGHYKRTPNKDSAIDFLKSHVVGVDIEKIIENYKARNVRKG